MTARAPPEEAPRRLPLRERVRRRRQTSATGYDAFISYSRTDVEFAIRLQRSLERFAKPWNRTRALRIFRDMSSLAPESDLRTSIERQMERSAWFILLLSPEAAASKWVNREIRWWLDERSADRMLIVVTDGELAFGGDRLFVQKDDGSLEVRIGARLERTLIGDPSYVWPPVPNPQGTLVARQRANHQITLVDVDTGSTLVTLPPNPGAGSMKIGIGFSPDGRRLATVTEGNGRRTRRHGDRARPLAPRADPERVPCGRP